MTTAIVSSTYHEADIYGQKFMVADEPADVYEWIAAGKWEAPTFAILQEYLTPRTSFVDAGAWIGLMSLYGSRLCKQVYAIEPDPVAFQILVNNLHANNVTNVRAFELALMRHSGTTSLGGGMLGCSCTRRTCRETSISVPSMGLREFCLGIPDPLFIKMDVEGAEADILRDVDFFRERKPTIFVSAHPGWWGEGGSSGAAEYAVLNEVARLYKHKSTFPQTASEYTDMLLSDAG